VGVLCGAASVISAEGFSGELDLREQAARVSVKRIAMKVGILI
jgi:hypothetical protein